MSYSPFESEFKDLKSDDLIALRTANEGWYIEYKREISKASTIAKSVSSFANTYGGWIFYGVEEKSKEDAVAGVFRGIKREDVDAALQCMRQAVAGHVNPAPHFNTKVLWGPAANVGLAEDRAVICVQVPRSMTAPHVHKSGQIYRRIADGSEPKAESDRFVLDQLWKRSDDLRKSYKKWVKRKPEFSEAEEELPYVRLLLVPDRWGDRAAWTEAPIEEIRSIFGNTTGLVSTLPFDNVYTAGNSFIARQRKDNDPHNLGLTWRFFRDLSSEILIPLNFYQNDLSSLVENFKGYKHAQPYAELLYSQGHRSPRVVDLNFLFNILVGISELQRNLLNLGKWTSSYFMKARLLNVWRITPFLDIASVLEEFRKHGTPMCLDSNIITPGGTEPETFAEVIVSEDVDDQKVRIILEALALFAPMAFAFGVPAWTDTRLDDESPTYYEELSNAGGRALEVQRLRSERQRRSQR